MMKDQDDGHGSVVAGLGRLIVQGRYAPGENLPIEGELCEQFGVSRTLLRESIKTLVAKGLVEVRRKTGSRVLPRESWHWFDPDVLAWRTSGENVDADLLRELTDARRIFEPAAAELAAKRASDAQVAQLAKYFSQMETAASRAEQTFIDADLRFHNQLLVCCSNAFLLQLSAAIAAALHASRTVTVQRPGASVESLALHRAVLESVASHDSDLARSRMLELIDFAARDIDAVLAHTDGGSALGDKHADGRTGS